MPQEKCYLHLYFNKYNFPVKLWIGFTVPCLILTFAALYMYYRFFHPWKSEEVSVGFTTYKNRGISILENDCNEGFYENAKSSEESSLIDKGKIKHY